MKTRIFIRGLIFAIAVYASVKVASGQSQPTSKKIYFRFGEKHVNELTYALYNRTKLANPKVYARRTLRTENSDIQPWYINTSKWNGDNSFMCYCPNMN